MRTRRHVLAVDRLSGAGELYDLVDDPLQLENRFEDEGLAAVRRELDDLLRARPGPLLTDFGEMSAPGGS